jgi:hypothetical protein
MSRECLPSIPKPRKRQSINGLGEPEIRGAPLSHILDNTALPLQTTSSRSPMPSHHGQPRYSDSLRHASGALSEVTQDRSQSFKAFFAQRLELDEHAPSFTDCLTGVDHAFVQESFSIFERMAKRSPFISPLVDSSRMDIMRTVSENPVTTLAICTVTVAANTELRHRLVRAFRQIISTKCIMEGRCSPDLMSGLSIHTMWHHRFMNKKQIYRYLHLLTGMTAELGLYAQASDYNNNNNNNYNSSETPLLFLGCHYLCTTLAGIASDKPSPFRWSDHLTRVAQQAGGRGLWIGRSDGPGLIELSRHLEDADTALRTANESEAPRRAWSIWHNSASILRRLKESFPRTGNFRSHPDMEASKIVMSSIILQNSSALPQNSHAKTLTEIAVHVKDYFDDLISHQTTTTTSIFFFTIVDWTNLLSVLAVLILILHPQFETWEAVPGAIRGLLEPEALLDTLVARMNGAHAQERHDELLDWFSALVVKIKVKWRQDQAAMRARTGSGDVSETEARFRPVNAGRFSGGGGDRFGGGGDSQQQHAPRPQSGIGGGGSVCEVEVGRTCKLDLLEDAFWERLLRS